jgi:Uma2 family endonuclease
VQNSFGDGLACKGGNSNYNISMASIETITTAQQLLEAPDLGRCELIRGELILMAPTGLDHGWYEHKIAWVLGNFVHPRKLGRILVGEVGFILERNPDTVRAPDVAFLRADRVPPGGMAGFFPGAPDLAVEILSPDDRRGEIQAKVNVWLAAGCSLVWVINPQKKILQIHHRKRNTVTLTSKDTLTAEELLPGFSLPLAELFE